MVMLGLLLDDLDLDLDLDRRNVLARLDLLLLLGLVLFEHILLAVAPLACTCARTDRHDGQSSNNNHDDGSSVDGVGSSVDGVGIGFGDAARRLVLSHVHVARRSRALGGARGRVVDEAGAAVCIGDGRGARAVAVLRSDWGVGFMDGVVAWRGSVHD